MKQYIIIAKNRKQDRNGNTYHDVLILDMNGDVIDSREKVYGYGSHYLQTAADMINAHEHNNETTYANIDDKSIIIFTQANEMQIIK